MQPLLLTLVLVPHSPLFLVKYPNIFLKKAVTGILYFDALLHACHADFYSSRKPHKKHTNAVVSLKSLGLLFRVLAFFHYYFPGQL